MLEGEDHKQFFGHLFSSIRNDELRDVTPEIDTIVAIGRASPPVNEKLLERRLNRKFVRGR